MNNKDSMPIVALIFAICGICLMGFANVEKTAMITGGTIAAIIGLVAGGYSVFKVDSKKVCSIIAIIICILTFIMRSMF